MKDMSGSGGDANALLTAATWTHDDGALYLKEFIHKHALPKLVRVVKGQYLNALGVPGIANSSPCQHFLLVGMGRKRRLLAQCVKFKDNRRGSPPTSNNPASGSSAAGGQQKVVTLGSKLAIPDLYDGYFEILSEDGRSVRCIESVAELCKRFPETVLVRDNLRAFASKSDDVDTIKDKSRVIERGETLILVGEVKSKQQQQKFLRCFDQRGENIYLPFELRSKFSAIAKEDNISGVHTANNLLNSKRLPLMARLVHGKPPRAVKNAGNSQFVPEMRLLSGLDEEFLVAMTLGKEPHAIPLPASALLKLQTAANGEQLSQTPEFERLVEKCRNSAVDFMEEMTTHDVAFSRDLRLHGLDKVGNGGVNNANNCNTYQRRRVKRNGHVSGGNGSGNNAPSSPKDDYDEIEQIYDYVRGFAPLPRSAKGWKYDAKPKDEPPEPPPIETIPGRNQHNGSPMDFSTPPTSPPISAVWDCYSPVNNNNNSNNNNPVIKDGTLGKSKEPKKRQRSSGKTTDENQYPTMTRFVKSATPFRHYNPGAVNPGGGATSQLKHRFFRNKSKELSLAPSPLSGVGASMTLSRSNIYSPLPHPQQQPHHGAFKASSPSSFFHLRYKSLTNLAAYPPGEYDTLDSSNSGGKTSGDSGGSRTLPEKRSRKLSRPKSLTNLVWGNSSRYNAAVSNDPGKNGNTNNKKNMVSTTSYTPKHQPQHHSSKMGTVSVGSAKRLGTLYL